MTNNPKNFFRVTTHTDLRDELKSESLTEEEVANKKAELLSIQNELTESYGKQVDGLKLVSGELEQQMSILDNVDTTSLDEWYKNNLSAIKNATIIHLPF